LFVKVRRALMSENKLPLYILIHVPTMAHDSRIHMINWQPTGRKWPF